MVFWNPEILFRIILRDTLDLIREPSGIQTQVNRLVRSVVSSEEVVIIKEVDGLDTLKRSPVGGVVKREPQVIIRKHIQILLIVSLIGQKMNGGVVFTQETDF